MSAPVPTLSSSGWVVELAEKVDRLMAYFFVSDHSQSNIYEGHVVSLPYIVQSYGNDDSSIRTAIQQNLNVLLGRYFEQSTVDVTVDLPTSDTDTRMTIRVDATVTDGRYRHSVGKLITTVNSRVVEIMDINNG